MTRWPVLQWPEPTGVLTPVERSYPRRCCGTCLWFQDEGDMFPDDELPDDGNFRIHGLCDNEDSPEYRDGMSRRDQCRHWFWERADA